MRSPSGRQDSNLRPSAPKALDTLLAALRFRAITNILRGVTLFVLTNYGIFVGDLSAILIFRRSKITSINTDFLAFPLFFRKYAFKGSNLPVT